MKKLLLILSVFTVINVHAQVLNYSFETWGQDTFYLPANVLGTLPADTAYYIDPAGWTTSNAITELDSFGKISLVTPDSNAFDGHLSAKMITSTIHVAVPPLISKEYVIPGFMLNGKFPITPLTLVPSGGLTGLTPGSVKGAGQPCTQRLASIRGHYNYQPVFDTITQAYDTCLIYATLRKDTEIIANAIYKSNSQTEGFGVFQANFEYLSCDEPDTLVILLASSIPNFSSLITGNGSLINGSVLLVDSIGYTVLPGNQALAPFARNDVSTVPENFVDSIDVLANDTDCSGQTPTVTISINPRNGTATVSDSFVIYTPNYGFYGVDSLEYKDENSTHLSATAWVYITVQYNTAITEPGLIPLQVYPIPSTGQLNVSFNNQGNAYATVYDMLGNVAYRGSMKNSNNVLNLQNLSNGFYNLQLVDATGTVIGRSKFVLDK